MKGRKGKSSLGRAIQNDKQRNRKKAPQSHAYEKYHTSDIEEKDNKLASITQTNDLSEMLMQAALANKEFVAEKQNVVILDSLSYEIRTQPTQKQLDAQLKHANELKVPRRPPWNESTTPEELDFNERNSFLEWRRELADLEKNEDLILTPFEKNLEVWRQLWRVVERSDIIVQIVDARNPLLMCTDLESYVQEVDPTKKCLLLVNKADLLTTHQRMCWARYFRKEGIKFIFWSANFERIKLEEKLAAAASDDSDEEEETHGGDENEEGSAPSTQTENADEDSLEYAARIVGVNQFLEHVMRLCPRPEGEPLTVGMVGYPNVGKSSTINVMCGEKKVNVSLTPGKTKHLQTIKLSDEVTLCDCPGLVFPSFLTTKAEMICSGLLPIDHMRDHRAPATLVCERIPRSLLEGMYGITLPRPGEDEDPKRPPTAGELLKAYGRIRGFMTVHGSPDESRAARIILKDYISGKLLYCHPPPNAEETGWRQWWEEQDARAAYSSVAPGYELKPSVRLPHEVTPEDQPAKKPKKAKRVGHVSYGQQKGVVAHTKGKAGEASFTRVTNKTHAVVPVRRLVGARGHAKPRAKVFSGPAAPTATATTATTSSTSTSTSST